MLVPRPDQWPNVTQSRCNTPQRDPTNPTNTNAAPVPMGLPRLSGYLYGVLSWKPFFRAGVFLGANGSSPPDLRRTDYRPATDLRPQGSYLQGPQGPPAYADGASGGRRGDGGGRPTLRWDRRCNGNAATDQGADHAPRGRPNKADEEGGGHGPKRGGAVGVSGLITLGLPPGLVPCVPP